MVIPAIAIKNLAKVIDSDAYTVEFSEAYTAEDGKTIPLAKVTCEDIRGDKWTRTYVLTPTGAHPID